MSRILKSNSIIESGKVFHIQYIEPVLSPITPEIPRQQEEAVLEKELALAHYNAILAQAQEEADRLLRSTQEETQKEKASILATAALEAEALAQTAEAESREVGFQQGYQAGVGEGLSSAKSEIEAVVHDTLCAIQQLQEKQLVFFQEYERNLHLLALDIAEKVLSIKLDQEPQAMLPLIKNALQTVKNKEWVSIEISDQMVELGKALKEDALIAQLEQVSVQLKDLPIGSCLIETEENVVDASISVQLEALKRLLDKVGGE